MIGLVGAAALNRAFGLPERTVRLLAVAMAILERFATRFWQVDQVEYDREAEAALAALGAEAYSLAWKDGQAIAAQDIQQITAFALEQLQPPVEQFAPVRVPDEQPRATANQAAKAKYGGLTARERQVAALIAAGKTNLDIAGELYIGVRTVEAHITRILTKLNYTSRTQVAVWARDVGLTEASAQ
jgi:non-specific serine/threonine protein kinase